MNPVNTVTCDDVIIDPSDIILMLVGGGVGYFVMGYLCMKTFHLHVQRKTEIKAEVAAEV